MLKKTRSRGYIYICIYIYPWTLRLLDQIGLVGRFEEKFIRTDQIRFDIKVLFFLNIFLSEGPIWSVSLNMQSLKDLPVKTS